MDFKFFVQEMIHQVLLERKQCLHECTVKFLNFRMPENFTCNLPKSQAKCPNLRVFRQKDANGIANSEDPDQTAPLGPICPKT